MYFVRSILHMDCALTMSYRGETNNIHMHFIQIFFCFQISYKLNFTIHNATLNEQTNHRTVHLVDGLRKKDDNFNDDRTCYGRETIFT